MSPYEAYFDSQVGSGKNLSHHDTGVYEVRREQTGCGIGRILGGLYRSAIPLIKRGSKEVGKETMRAGLKVMKDVAQRKIPLKTALKRRMKESGDNLKRKAEQKINQLIEDLPYKSTDSQHGPQLPSSSEVEQSPSESAEKPTKRIKISRAKKSHKQNTKNKTKDSKKKTRSVVDIFKKNN